MRDANKLGGTFHCDSKLPRMIFKLKRNHIVARKECRFSAKCQLFVS